MRKSIYKILVAGVVLSSIGPLHAADKDRRDRKDAIAASEASRDMLDDRARDLNRVVDREKNMDTALKYISVETGVPEERVRDMHKRHPDAGPAGILNACVLADETKKEPEDFLKHHVAGKGWAALARDNNVSLDKMTVRLDHLERALNTGDYGRNDRRSPDANKHRD